MPINQIEFQNPIIDQSKPRAVVDYMKWMDNIEIKHELEKTKNNFGILMVNIDYDNNSGNIIRTANAFGAIEIVLYGRKKFDRRSSMGTEFYMNFQQIKYIEEIDEVLQGFDLIVGLDNIEESINIFEYDWDLPISKKLELKETEAIDSQPKPRKPKTLICLGQESTGLPEEIIKRCDQLVHIPQYGSVRSLNVGTAAGIAMYDFVNKSQK
jgi:tRNA G18 (ribose-2'-O)-methylase SpoU